MTAIPNQQALGLNGRKIGKLVTGIWRNSACVARALLKMGELTAQGSLNNASQACRDSINLSKTEECDCPSREFILLISGLRFTCNRNPWEGAAT